MASLNYNGDWLAVSKGILPDLKAK